jgi:hypothetical protein
VTYLFYWDSESTAFVVVIVLVYTRAQWTLDDLINLKHPRRIPYSVLGLISSGAYHYHYHIVYLTGGHKGRAGAAGECFDDALVNNTSGDADDERDASLVDIRIPPPKVIDHPPNNTTPGRDEQR